jgi:putative intracellular protease/amidase
MKPSSHPLKARTLLLTPAVSRYPANIRQFCQTLTEIQAFAQDQAFLDDPDVKAKFAAAKKLTEVKAADYDAIFYVGGHGPIQDLVTNEVSGKLASEVSQQRFIDWVLLQRAFQFYQAGKITAAVCHGTA